MKECVYLGNLAVSRITENRNYKYNHMYVYNSAIGRVTVHLKRWSSTATQEFITTAPTALCFMQRLPHMSHQDTSILIAAKVTQILSPLMSENLVFKLGSDGDSNLRPFSCKAAGLPLDQRGSTDQCSVISADLA